MGGGVENTLAITLDFKTLNLNAYYEIKRGKLIKRKAKWGQLGTLIQIVLPKKESESQA